MPRLTLIFPRDRRRNRIFSDTQSDIIRSVYVSRKPVKEADAIYVGRMFNRMLEEKLRLECDCNADADGNRPLLYAARPSHLKKMPNSLPLHNPDTCCFGDRRRSQSQGIETVTSWVSVIPLRNRGDDDSPAAVHSRFPTPSVGHTPQANSSKSSTPSPPPISRLLFRLLDKAKLNIIRYNQVEPCSALANGAKKVLLASSGSKKLFLAERLIATKTYDNDFIDKFEQMRADVETGRGWPDGPSRPQAFLCGIASSASYNANPKRYEINVYNSGKPRFSEQKPFIFASNDTMPARAPYIYILSYALPSPTDRRAKGMKCYMHPVYTNDIWFPVDSDAERGTLDVLLHWRSSLSRDTQVVIGKPMFDLTRSGTPVRPDFVLFVTKDGKKIKIAVESMGLADDPYAERKSRTHPAMLKSCNFLIQHDTTPVTDFDITAATELFKQHLESALHGVQPFYESIAADRGS